MYALSLSLSLSLPVSPYPRCNNPYPANVGPADNANFASQVAAMEARAKQLHLPPKTLHYLWPQGPGDSPGRTDFAPTEADAQQINALGLGRNILSDIHGPAMGGVAKAEIVFAENATLDWGAMNLEVE